MPRDGYALLPSLLFMLGCPSGEPDNAVVLKIEERLANDPCLTGIENLRREYRFARRGWKIDPNRIDVKVQEPGLDGLPAGRFILQPVTSVGADDRDYFGAWATYAVSEDELDIWACGGNTSADSFRHKARF